MSPRVDRAGVYRLAARDWAACDKAACDKAACDKAACDKAACDKAACDKADCDWRVEFIQPTFPGDDRCIMLYGREGEIVGPLTMQLAEAWIDHFDSARYGTMLRERLSTTSGTSG